MKEKHGQYGFLTELNDTVVDQISIEAAQPRLDLSVLAGLAKKTIILGVLDLGDDTVETPEVIAGRLRAALEYVEPERLMAGAGLRNEVPPARGRGRKARRNGAWGGDRPKRALIHACA